jgi:hypothetical protein
VCDSCYSFRCACMQMLQCCAATCSVAAACSTGRTCVRSSVHCYQLACNHKVCVYNCLPYKFSYDNDAATNLPVETAAGTLLQVSICGIASYVCGCVYSSEPAQLPRLRCIACHQQRAQPSANPSISSQALTYPATRTHSRTQL